MEDIGVKAAIIGTYIFITIVIVSLFLFSFNQMKEIFSIAKTTDTSIHTQFNNSYDKYVLTYHSKDMLGIDIINALRIAEQEDEVKITVIYPQYSVVRRRALDLGMRPSEFLKYLMDSEEAFSGKIYRYDDKYKVYVNVRDNTSDIEIEFNEI